MSEDIEPRLDALSNWVDNVAERVAELEDENRLKDQRINDLEEQIEHLESAVAATPATDGGSSKKEHALQLTRNELIRRAAIDAPPQDRPVTVRDVKEMAKPQRSLRYQTVKNAWADLLERHSCFAESMKRGDKAMSVRTEAITPELIHLVEVDLGRSDLTKRLMSENQQGRTA